MLSRICYGCVRLPGGYGCFIKVTALLFSNQRNYICDCNHAAEVQTKMQVFNIYIYKGCKYEQLADYPPLKKTLHGRVSFGQKIYTTYTRFLVLHSLR